MKLSTKQLVQISGFAVAAIFLGLVIKYRIISPRADQLVITNQAGVTYDGGSSTSNQVSTTIGQGQPPPPAPPPAFNPPPPAPVPPPPPPPPPSVTKQVAIKTSKGSAKTVRVTYLDGNGNVIKTSEVSVTVTTSGTTLTTDNYTKLRLTLIGYFSQTKDNGQSFDPFIQGANFTATTNELNRPSLSDLSYLVSAKRAGRSIDAYGGAPSLADLSSAVAKRRAS